MSWPKIQKESFCNLSNWIWSLLQITTFIGSWRFFFQIFSTPGSLLQQLRQLYFGQPQADSIQKVKMWINWLGHFGRLPLTQYHLSSDHPAAKVVINWRETCDIAFNLKEGTPTIHQKRLNKELCRLSSLQLEISKTRIASAIILRSHHNMTKMTKTLTKATFHIPHLWKTKIILQKWLGRGYVSCQEAKTSLREQHSIP